MKISIDKKYDAPIRAWMSGKIQHISLKLDNGKTLFIYHGNRDERVNIMRAAEHRSILSSKDTVVLSCWGAKHPAWIQNKYPSQDLVGEFPLRLTYSPSTSEIIAEPA